MILLYNPRSCRHNYRLPLSLLSLGAALEGKHEYEIVDGNFLEDPFSVLPGIISASSVDLVGMTVMPGPQLQEAIPLSRVLKRLFPSLKIVWGGYFPSNHTGVCIDSPWIDYVVRGQGEAAFPKLIDSLEASRSMAEIPNLSYKAEGAAFHNASAPLLHPDQLPPIPYHRVDVGKYISRTYLGSRTLSYHSSYGCPFECGFCAVVPIYRARWLGKSAGNMADDIEKLLADYGADAIEFHDNNFFTSEKRVREFSELILRREMQFSWWGEGRPDTLLQYSEDTFALMKRAGLKMVFMGAESGDDAGLEHMNKGGTQSGKVILEVVDKFRRHGIVPECSFVLGTPSSDVEAAIDRDIRFIRSLKRLNSQTEIIIYVYSPIPVNDNGLFNDVQKSGFKFPSTLDEWTTPRWANFDLRRNPLTPWIKPSHIDRIKSFEKVLNAVYPTNSDLKLKGYQRQLLGVAGNWRYATRMYAYPYEIKLLQRLFKYRRPETEGF